MTATITQLEHSRKRAEARRIPIRGASIGDIAKTMEEIDLLTSLYLSAVEGHVSKLNENLSERGPDMDEFRDLMRDFVADHLTGRLAVINRQREEWGDE